jgi:DNA-binding CsgD family transcriptional regulator/tetratricopeptide (TPR) repeat protein
MSAGELLERDEPRLRLEAALADARKGRGSVVSLEGEAGIGKTALTVQFVDAHRGDARVYVGSCEHLSTPEPMGPLRDIARESHGRFAVSPVGRLATYEALHNLLVNGRGPALLVLEDIHWADEATLDLLRFLGRRIRGAAVVVLVTFRNDEPDSAERLSSLWADMPRDARERIELQPLSLEAVGRLVHRHSAAAQRFYEVSGGNPFQVTEYLAADGEGVPRSVLEVTVARAARLPRNAKRTLECASIFPRRIDEEMLRLLSDDVDHEGVEACLAIGMLNARDGALSFRHELARRAINQAMSPLRRRELHAAALALLKRNAHGRAAEIAHHAEQAGAIEDLLTYSIRAAADAAAVGAHREAMAHTSIAIKHSHALPDLERARLLERQAMAANFCGAFDEAVQALEQATVLYRAAGDVLGLGDALRLSAHVQWNLGDPATAEVHMRESVQVLDGERGSWQYAMSMAALAQCEMLADRHAGAIAAAEQALELAEQLGRWDIGMQALNFMRTSRASMDPKKGLPALIATVAEVRERGELDALPRLYGNLTSIMVGARRYEGLAQLIDEAIAFCAEREHIPVEALVRGNRAVMLLDTGELQAAISEAEDVVFGPYPKNTAALPALIALSRSRVRLGLAEGGLLQQALRLPGASRDLLWRAPIALAQAEADWLDGGDSGAADRLVEVAKAAQELGSQTWNIGEAAFWLTTLGRTPRLDAPARARLSPPHAAYVDGRWREAADLFAANNRPYERAIALSGGDEAAQREAVGLFDGLGAAPAARNLRRRLRADGVRSVPSGPRTARRADPSGLTRRQNEVLDLLVSGLPNAEIAEVLGLSAKTVEHHVSAILAALDAPSRLAAVRIARERSLSAVV